MHIQLERYIEEKGRERHLQRGQEMIEEGLFIKEYSPTNEYSEEYNLSDWDERTQTLRFYKRTAIPFTEEDYQKFRECQRTQSAKSKRSGVATLLLVIAVLIYIGAFISGLVLGMENIRYTEEFLFELAWPQWSGGFIFGSFTLGFAEIVHLLRQINEK